MRHLFWYTSSRLYAPLERLRALVASFRRLYRLTSSHGPGLTVQIVRDDLQQQAHVRARLARLEHPDD